MTSIAELRRRVVIEAPVRISDGGGGAELTWIEVATVWASVRATPGAERLEADGIKGRLIHEVVMRWRGDVTPAMRLRMEQTVLDIRSAFDPEGQRRWLTCRCEERLP